MTTPCRSAKTECDLAEFCNGKSEYCPKDVHKQDGLKCKGGDVSYRSASAMIL